MKIRKIKSDPAVGTQEALAFPGHIALKGEADPYPLAFLEALLRLMRHQRLKLFPFSVNAERPSSLSLNGPWAPQVTDSRTLGEWAKSSAESGNPMQLSSLPPREA